MKDLSLKLFVGQQQSKDDDQFGHRRTKSLFSKKLENIMVDIAKRVRPKR